MTLRYPLVLSDSFEIEELQTGDYLSSTGQPATQAEMEAGTEEALRAMSPLRIAQAIAALANNAATGGGDDRVFVQNQLVVTTDYTFSLGYSASSVGPIEINAGVTVTIPDGHSWVIL